MIINIREMKEWFSLVTLASLSALVSSVSISRMNPTGGNVTNKLSLLYYLGPCVTLRVAQPIGRS